LSGEPGGLNLSMFCLLIAYLDYQVYLARILPSVKLTKSGTFVRKTIHMTSSGLISGLGLGPGASLLHILCLDPSVPWVFLDVHAVPYSLTVSACLSQTHPSP
jgi:hypothetical protein